MKKAVCLIVTTLVVVLFAGYVSSVWESYHDFEGRCLDCHLYEPERGGAAPTFVKDITLMCVECHEEFRDMSHPVDMVPAMEVPGVFPLDWKGTITCATCHPVHKKGFGDFRLRVAAVGEGFCVYCHFDMENDLHKVGIGSAHTSSVVNVGYDVLDLNVTLDDLSLKCLACHDAVFGVESLVENKTLGFHVAGTIGLSHPVGVSYIEAKRKYKAAYRDLDELPGEIQLYGGIVGCGSCHNPYSSRHDQLAMSNEGSRLCLACHVK
ncbi:MAG TPA: cytochrome c3 family protein [Thermodesulfobacteriota bacterium]|nr:cytochrome c3 family protein [Thermodesulfobacteriota bacterium]